MGLMKKLTSALVASSLVLSLVGSAFAAYTPAAGEEAGTRMQKLGIIQGRDGNDLALNSEITRAELVTVIVRAFGKEDDAKLLKGSTIFPDIANHWASGNIAMAVALVEKAGSDPIGMPDGTFAPDAKLTPAQAVAFLMKFMGAKADATKAWPANYLDVAVEKGLITTEDKALIAPMLNDNATRGLVFYMFDRAFAEYNLGAGKTFYTKYVDTIAPELSLDAVAETTMDSKVTISGTVKGHTKLHVGTTAVTADANGKFSAEVALAEIDSYDITVTAQDLAGNVTEKTVSVARVTGEAVAISAPASIEVVAGETADVAAKVIDANDVALADVNVDGASDLGTYENGVFTAGETAGTGTLTLTYGDLTKEVAVTVKAGALAKLVVSPETVDLTTTGTQKFEVAGADAYGNEVEVTGDVKWSKSAGVISADGEFAAAGATGTVTVTAAIGDITGTATVNVFGVPAKVVVSAPASFVANNKSEVELTAMVVDANGNPVKNYTGSVTFASSNTSAATVKTASVAAVNGVATTTIKAGTSATATILSASAQGLTGTTVVVTPTAQTLSSIAVTSDVSSLAATANSRATLTLKMKDQTGNDMLALPTASTTVRLTTSDKSVVSFNAASAVETTDVTFDAVSKTVYAYGTAKVGGANITGAVTLPTGSTVTVSSVSLNTLVVGAAYQLKIDDIATVKAGEAQTAKVRILDFNGNQLTTTTADTINLTVKRVNADGVETSLSTTLNTTYGVGSLNVNTTTAGTYTLKVTGTGLQAAPDATFSINPASAAQVTLAASPAKIQAAASAQSTLKVTVKDQYGNKVTDGSYAVTIKKTNNNNATAAFADSVINTVNGEATVTVTGTTNQATDTFTATATGLTGSTATVQTLIMGAPHKLGLESATPSGTAGSDIAVNVKVLDASSSTDALTYDNGRVVTVTVKDGNTVVGTFTGTTTNGVASVKVNVTTAKAYTFEATSEGLVKATGTSITVNPAAAASLAVTADRTELAADGFSKAKLTVTMKDQYGNKVTPATGTKVYLKVTDGTAVGAFEGGFLNDSTSTFHNWVELTESSGVIATADGATSFKATAAGGTAVITARSTSSAIADGTVSLVARVAGTKPAFTVDAVADAKVADALNNYQTVKVRITDAAGVLLTNDTSNVTIKFAGATGTVDVYSSVSGSGTAITAADTTFDTDTDANEYTVAAVKGIATFYVTNTKADTLTYTVFSAGADSKTATGRFTPADAASVTVAATPARINGDGIALTTLTASVIDASSNTVAAASGNVTFEISSGNDYAALQQTSATLVNGQAAVVLQSKLVPNGTSSQINIKVGFDLDGDGTIEDGEKWIVSNVVFVDAVDPVGTVTIPEATAGVVAAATINPTVTVPTAGEDIKEVKFEYRATPNGAWITAGTVTATTTATTNTVWTSPAITGLVEGTYELRATLTDDAGRVAAMPVVAFTVDLP